METILFYFFLFFFLNSLTTIISYNWNFVQLKHHRNSRISSLIFFKTKNFIQGGFNSRLNFFKKFIEGGKRINRKIGCQIWILIIIGKSTVVSEESVSKQDRLNCKCLCLATKGSTSRLCTLHDRYMIG